MNNARHGLSRILADTFPDAHDVSAGGIDKDAAFFLELRPRGDFSSKGRDDDNIATLEVFDIRVFLFSTEKADVHGANLIVDLGIVNDLSENIDRLVWKDFPRRISQVDGSFDPV